MNPTADWKQVLRSRQLLAGVGIVFGIQLLILLLTTPMYDIDTNSFIRGGLSWDIYHNPFLNIFVAVFSKIWSNLYFLVSLQILGFAFAAAFLARVLFSDNKLLWGIAIAIAALEPVTMFYNFSLIAESFYATFTLLSVAWLILWFRAPKPAHAIGFGLFLGLTFLTKLSAMVHTPLFLLMLLRWQQPVAKRLAHLGIALIPFVACYYFVSIGQAKINGGGLYTVEGRVKWDFSSSQYRPDEIEDAAVFKRFVNPTIFSDAGEMEPHRERRRELSYLGYKACVAHYDSVGMTEVGAINCCDSIFGAVADQIMEKHFWEAEKQFISDNITFIHHLNYLDYRFTPNLYYYHPKAEYTYIDSLMRTHFGVDLSQREDRIPGIWKSLKFGNTYMPVLFWLYALIVLVAGIRWLRDRMQFELLVMGVLAAIPLVFHIVYISYRPRFLAPYLVLALFLGVFHLLKRR